MAIPIQRWRFPIPLPTPATVLLVSAFVLFFASLPLQAQSDSAQTTSAQTDMAQTNMESVVHGQLPVDGQMRQYTYRKLPVSSFPELPSVIAATLTARGCMIPQTWQAHRPENVVRGSFQRPGSQDWAILCSVRGTTSLLVFFAPNANPAAQPVTLAQWPETLRLQQHDPYGVLGFNWGIDAASPAQFRDAFASSSHPPATPDHDSVADSVIDRKTVFHLYTSGQWQQYEADE